MPKFRKKPVVIEAAQYFKNVPQIPGVCDGICIHREGMTPHVHTLEGDHKVTEGDWIITGVKGEKYPCKPDIFAMTYEPVAPDATGDRASDTQIVDWIEEFITTGVLETAFELDGGIHLTLSTVGDKEEVAFREQNTFREAARKAMNPTPAQERKDTER